MELEYIILQTSTNECEDLARDTQALYNLVRGLNNPQNDDLVIGYAMDYINKYGLTYSGVLTNFRQFEKQRFDYNN